MSRTAKQHGAVPQLRFPGFAEKWEAKRLGKVADIYKGKGVSKADLRGDGIHQCIRYGELYTIYGEVITEVVSRTSLPAEALFFGEANDVIIPSSGETKEDIATAACVVPAGVALGGDLNVLRSQEVGVFLSYYLNGPLSKDISHVAQGNSVVHLYPNQIEKLSIDLPSKAEQQKIADCLSSLDASIGAETRKLDALKTHKQGLMQQLFPAQGQRLPSLRFPGFQGTWDEALLKSHIKTVTPPKKLQTSQYMDRGDYPVIDQSQAPIAGWTDDAESLIEGPFPLIVFGDHTCTLKLAEKPFAQGADGIKIFSATQGVSTGYLYQFLLARPLIMQDYRRHFSILKERIVHFPVDAAEQTRIFEFLSGLDALVEAQARKIAALKQHKKGLMQGLFPAAHRSATED